MTLSEQDLRKLARLGAIARLKELEEEARAIRKMFPGLRTTEPESAAAGPSAAPRKRKGMSKEARRAQAERMRAYWAERRSAKADGADAVATPAEGAADAGPKKGRRARRKKG